MATKKSSKKKKKPTTAFAKDVAAALEKHSLSGSMFISPLAMADIQCPPGKHPHEITYKKKGKWVTETICI